MKPYYSEDGVTIFHADCREVLPNLGRGVVVTDPPYNIGYEYESWADDLPPDEYAALLTVSCRLPSVVIHLPEEMFVVSDALCCTPGKVVAWIYNAHVGDSWRSIAWFGLSPDFSVERREYRNPDDRRVKRLMQTKPGGGPRIRDWWHIEQVKGNANEKFVEHHCQIPNAVMRRIVNITPIDGPVIDPFCGTGTTLEAARGMGHEAIGIEICEAYCEIAAKRLSQRVLEFK